MSEQQKNQIVPAAAMPATQLAEVNESADAFDLTELLFRLLGSWKLIIALALVCAIIAGIYTVFLVTPQYKATSTIYVLSRKDSAINMSDLQIGSALTQDYIRVFDMWEVHEEVISNLNLPYDYTTMRNMLSIANYSDTRILYISFTSPDPNEAATVANEYARVVSQYIADTMATDKPNIMSVALTPDKPVSPNKTRNVMIGFALGALLAVAIVTIRFLMDDKYRTAEDIRKYTGLNTLAIIPDEELDDDRDRKKSKASRREL